MASFDEARKQLLKGELAEGFANLWELKGADLFSAKLFTKTAAHEAITLQSPNPLPQHQATITYFWSEFICRDQVYHTLFNSEKASKYLSTYFLGFAKASAPLLQKLATDHPHLLIRAVRNYRAFLHPQFKGPLQQLSFFTPEQNEHQRAWQYIARTDEVLWLEVESHLKKLSNTTTSQIQIDTSIWIEYEQFEGDPVNEAHTQFLVRVYNFFVSHCVTTGLFKETNPSQKQFLVEYFKRQESYCQSPSSYHQSAITQTLNAIKQWMQFKENLLDMYCFSSEYRFEQTHTLWLLATSPQQHYRFKLDGTRYGLNQFLYEKNAQSALDHRIEKGLKIIPKGKLPSDDAINYQIAKQAQAIWLMLQDLAFTRYDSHTSLASIELLQSHASNLSYRYEMIKKQLSVGCNSYWELIELLRKEAKEQGIEMVPFVYKAKSSYFAQIRSMSKELLDIETIQPFIGNLCFSVHDTSNEAFDRFNPQYSSATHPFIEHNGFLFTPAPVFAITWFYALAQKYLTEEKKEYKTDESDQFEKNLVQHFRGKGFKVVHTGRIHAQGDADLLIYDDHNLLLIQLKRTKLRLTSEDLHIEEQNNLSKGCNQLLRFEDDLDNNLNLISLPEDFPALANLKITKWVASTSFEHSSYEYQGCKKANYFEIIHTLTGPVPFASLKTFIDYIERDQLLYDVCKSLREHHEHKAETPNLAMPPIPIFEPKAYRLPIRTNSHEDLSDHVHALFEKALQLHQGKNYEKAIKLLRRCNTLDPIDPEIQGALANVYADIGNRAEALKCFKKALQLLPNDPFIWRNYILYLRQHGERVYKRQLKDWLHTYPFIHCL